MPHDLQILLAEKASQLAGEFLGICIRESGIKAFQDLVSNTILYTATLFLGLTLGVLCEASTIFDPKVLPLLLLGAALGSGTGGIRLELKRPVGCRASAHGLELLCYDVLARIRGYPGRRPHHLSVFVEARGVRIASGAAPDRALGHRRGRRDLRAG